MVYVVAALVGVAIALHPLLTHRLIYGEGITWELTLGLSALAVPSAALVVGLVWLAGR